MKHLLHRRIQICTKRCPSVLPAYWLHRRWRCLTSMRSRSQPLALSLSRYGVNFSRRNDFPRYHPRATARRRSGSTDISRYGLAFHLPDKEFRYLRTVIVTAAVYRGFSSSLAALPLTFRHRAGVSPYTSPYGFAETCVFSKQSVGPLNCNPQLLRR